MNEQNAPVAHAESPQVPSAPTVDLRALAEASRDSPYQEERDMYVRAVDDPRVVLALLDRLEALEAALLHRLSVGSLDDDCADCQQVMRVADSIDGQRATLVQEASRE